MEKGRVRVFPLIEYYRYSSIFSVYIFKVSCYCCCLLILGFIVFLSVNILLFVQYICLNIHIYQVYIPPVWRLKKTRWTTTQQATSRNHPNTENIYPTHKGPNNETSFPFGKILNRRLCLLPWPGLIFVSGRHSIQSWCWKYQRILSWKIKCNYNCA